MGELVEKEVRMGSEDWHRLATGCVTKAVQCIHDEGPFVSGHELKAAEYLRAAQTFRGHANMLEIEGGDDVAMVDVWDLSDEENEPEPAWPGISAKLHEIAGTDPKLLPMVEQIDKLHALAVEKGLPVITKDQLEEALAA